MVEGNHIIDWPELEDDLLYSSSKTVVHLCSLPGVQLASKTVLAASCSVEPEYRLLCRVCSPVLEKDSLVEACGDAVERSRAVRIVAPLHHSFSGRNRLVLPYLGKSLRQFLIDENPLSVSDALSIARDVAVALGHCHAQRVLHLDVKPGNVIVAEEGGRLRAYLIDFGCATVLPRRGVLKKPELMGTINYMAPEQTGRLDVGIGMATDLFSLGVTLYEMVGKQLPFRTKSLRATLYARIAVEARPLPEDVPVMVRRMCSKLLMKDPRERYSSCRSLVDDIDALLEDNATEMPLDYPPKYMTPRPAEKLYGREDALDCVVETCRGVLLQSTLLIVEGESGSGKSTLIAAARHAFLGDSSIVLSSGKFQQYDRPPYGAITIALERMLQHLRNMEPERQSSVSLALQQPEFLVHAKVLDDICPYLRELCDGHNSEEVVLEPATTTAEATQRIHQALIALFEVFYVQCEIRMVIFLDDLQWSDDASISLMKALLLDSTFPVVMITAYRPEEISETHIVYALLSSFKGNASVNVIHVDLAPLETQTVRDLIEGMLSLDAEEGDARKTLDLAEFVFKKTAGNPFFILQLMYSLCEDLLIRYEWREGWVWNLDTLQAVVPATNNVIEFLMTVLRQLPCETQSALCALACAGFRPTTTLAALFLQDIECTKETVLEHLRPALEMDIIVQRTDESEEPVLVFLHDRLQEGSLCLIPADERIHLHHRIGYALAKHLRIPLLGEVSPFEDAAASVEKQTGPSDLYFSMIDHLCSAKSLLQESHLRIVARLATTAARQARARLAYEQAYRYFEFAASTEEGLQSWDDRTGQDRERIWRLHCNWAATAFNCLKFDDATKLYNECQKKAQSTDESVEVLRAKVFMFSQRELYDDAIDAGIEACSLLGLELEKYTTRESIIRLMNELVFDALKGFEEPAVDVFASFPQIFDRHAEWLDLTLGSMIPAAYLSHNMTLHTAVGLWVTALTLKRRGFTAGAPAGIAYFGFSIMGNYGMLEESYMLSNSIALPLLARRVGPRVPLDGSIYATAGLCTHWGPILSPALRLFETGFEIALKMGDFAWCVYSRTFHLWFTMQAGVSYKQVMVLFEQWSPFVKKAGMRDMFQSMVAVNYACRLLRGQFRECDTSKMLELETAGPRPAFADAAVFCWMMFAYHLIGRDSDAHRCWVHFDKPTLIGSVGMSPHYEYHWIGPLVCSSYLVNRKSVCQCRDSPEWASIQECRDNLRRWEEVSCRNWSAKRLLVDALILWVKYVHPDIKSENEEIPNLHKVLGAFESAISVGKKTDFPQVVAVAASKAAFVCQVAQELSSLHEHYKLMEYKAWRELDANALTSHIIDRYPSFSIIFKEVTSDKSTLKSESSLTVNSLGGSLAQMDTLVLVRAVQIISREVDRENVLRTFTQLIEESSGGQRIVVALKNVSFEEDSQRTQSRRKSSGVSLSQFSIELIRENQVTSTTQQPLKKSVLPLSLLSSCGARGEPIVLSDVQNEWENENLTDEYFSICQRLDDTVRMPRSVMVVPVPNLGKIIGFLYMENYMSGGVFHIGIVKTISLLANQLGTSITNARLYERLTAQTQALRQRNKQIMRAHRANLRFVPEAFLQRIGRRNTAEVELGDGVGVELAVMFADVRGFTSLSESMVPREVFRFLNQTLSRIIPAVTESRGSVDKFLGDGSLALFDCAADAVAAAQRIHSEMRALNKTEGGPSIRMGIGIHFGPTMIGCIGNEDRLDATVVGDTVNLASRIEGMTKHFGADTLITDQTVTAMYPDANVLETFCPLMRSLGMIRVMGKTQSCCVIQVFEDPERLRRRGDTELAANTEHMLTRRAEFYAMRRALECGEREAGLQIYSKLRHECPYDTVLTAMADRVVYS